MSLVSLKDLSSDYGQTEIYYDPANQRRKVWLIPILANFIMSVCRGWSQLTTVVLADVRRCRDHSRAIGDMASYEYFQRINKKGYRYISLDGMNRTKHTIDFLNNKSAISGIFMDADENKVEITNKHFKDFPQRLKDRILSGFMNIQIAPACTRRELADIFLALNSGEPLNRHEKRNAFQTPISDWVRHTSQTYKEALERVMSSKDVARMKDDELIAKMTMTLMNNNPTNRKNGGKWDLNDNRIDQFYNLGLGYYTLDDPDSPYQRPAIERVEQILEMWSHTICNQKHYGKGKNVAAKMLWATLYACEWAYDNGYAIPPESYDVFFKSLKELDDELISTSTLAHANELERRRVNNLDPDEVSIEDYYFRWINLPHQAPARSKRVKQIVTNLKKNPWQYGLRRVADSRAKIAI